jgi:hypothetical protein
LYVIYFFVVDIFPNVRMFPDAPPLMQAFFRRCLHTPSRYHSRTNQTNSCNCELLSGWFVLARVLFVCKSQNIRSTQNIMTETMEDGGCGAVLALAGTASSVMRPSQPAGG